MKTVQELRQSGYKVRVIHKRERLVNTFSPNTLGGTTIVELRTPEGAELRAEARCSTKDNYSKKLGVKIALGRIFTNL